MKNCFGTIRPNEDAHFANFFFIAQAEGHVAVKYLEQLNPFSYPVNERPDKVKAMFIGKSEAELSIVQDDLESNGWEYDENMV